MLEYLASHPGAPSLAILSNGSAIDERWAAQFSRLKVKFVQLSVEGTEQTHDEIRGRGHFQQVLTATKHLTDAGIRVLWSFTAHNRNSQEFVQVAELAHQAKVNRLWSDRLIPNDHRDSPLTLNPQQSSDYFRQMGLAREQLQAKADNQTEIAMIRALQFQEAGDQPYRCSAGAELITIMPDGSVLPCRRLPINVGNLWQRPLTEIYHQAPQLRELRGFSAPQECRSCLYRTNCRGGLRCLAYARYKDPYRADPGCGYRAAD
ncbi:SPASM domain-containing protein [Serratia sp. L9]|uniref:SPASM domain-containing protein n=1 Tax=Serratia sp. L9 TaxID=3423946 RepID=UPI003D66C9C6